MTDATPEQKKEIDTRWAVDKPLWDNGGIDSCAGCLENGEPIDEQPLISRQTGEQVIGMCANCCDTAFEIHAGYAHKAIYGG